jgi:hypothetical protein
MTGWSARRSSMRRIRAAVVVFAIATAAASAAAVASVPAEVAVHVRKPPGLTGDIGVRFSPITALPSGGYYYAVVVLKPYRHFTRTAPPPCAAASDMQKTAYGYARPGQVVSLVLTRARSSRHAWCPGGDYVGAIYAVPNPPPCESRYPCASEYSELSPCWETVAGHKVCGVVAQPRAYAYPDGLPAPREKGTRIIGHFRVTF